MPGKVVKNPAQLKGKQKVALLLACLGPDYAKSILANLTDEEVEEITLELASLGTVDADVRAQVMDEFYQMAVAKRFVAQGGVQLAKEMLEKAFGPERAYEVLARLQSSLQEVPFQFLKRADATQIVSFLQEEHPQTIALVLAHLPPQTSALILSALPQAVQSEVVMRIATMDRTPPEIVREVERVLERKMSAIFTQGFTFAGGVKDAAEILNRIERSAEKNIMADLQERDPQLADEIGRLMFTFDDIVYVDDAGIQKALREVDSKDLALALKAATEDVQNKIFKNMSERARQMIKEEIEFMGPVRLRLVEEAQQRIVAVIRRLEEAGELFVSRGGAGGDEVLV
jgi:flagellar motor switch protein FliG